MWNSALCQETEMPPDMREEAMDGVRLSRVGVGVSRMLREEPWCWCGRASEGRRQFSGAPRESEETSRGCKWLKLSLGGPARFKTINSQVHSLGQRLMKGVDHCVGPGQAPIHGNPGYPRRWGGCFSTHRWGEGSFQVQRSEAQPDDNNEHSRAPVRPGPY